MRMKQSFARSRIPQSKSSARLPTRNMLHWSLYQILKNNSYFERAAFCGLLFPFTLARRRKDIYADQSRNVRTDGQQRGYAAYRKLAGLGSLFNDCRAVIQVPVSGAAHDLCPA